MLVIHLAKDVHSGKNIDSVDRRSVMGTPLEMLERQQINIKLVKPSVRLPPMREVSYALEFWGKLVMQIG